MKAKKAPGGLSSDNPPGKAPSDFQGENKGGQGARVIVAKVGLILDGGPVRTDTEPAREFSAAFYDGIPPGA